MVARRGHPDIVPMHLEMPVMDGYAAMRALKTDRPVVLRRLLERIEETLLAARPTPAPTAPAAPADPVPGP
jgi:CheY-like chemotaxis protein